MTAIECFFLRPSAFAQETLRRYTYSNDCPNTKYHTCSVEINIVPYDLAIPHDGEPGKGIEHNDPRWPTECQCGYKFKPEDEWQHQLTRLYWRSDHLALRVTLSDAPIGAMYYGDWYHWKGPDRHCLVVITPGGPWVVDGPSTNNDGSRGPSWTRTGEVPKITVTPSILFPGVYHGWLKNGVLESVDGSNWKRVW